MPFAEDGLSTLALAGVPAFLCRRTEGGFPVIVARTPQFLALMQAVTRSVDERRLLSSLAAAWQHAGGTAVNGLGMLLRQAVGQIRIFATGDPDQPLPREEAVVAVMRLALVGD